MYVPRHFQMDPAEAVAFMRAHPFAILVTAAGGTPVATHLPVQVHEQGERIGITGHIAAANEQKETFAGGTTALLIFHGPHTYISSSWYTVDEVPTWNYLAVHAYGTLRTLSEEELEADLKYLLLQYEGHRENGRLWDTLPPGLLARQMKGIVGFRVDVTRLEAKAKMSQNRKDIDYKHIVERLEASPDPMDHAVAAWMRAHRQHLFNGPAQG
ncbi:FMN-binding negative transcriptional regulator [Thermaerobacter sp. PB12/4term]|uniref:FMN-binding negative transcriptional regulator n=1 Tax=Thermaerobacter sp. PB12/4term TaxID=2293838 RepID=UPI000E329B44|nr:FMN-binding negative transcriptional regulator [Thermaerobacter sp. PB12/4term]QIA26819.1 FMN-binding negative transcriptional regulator [Thermaerobacter sp. PB12/4term]